MSKEAKYFNRYISYFITINVCQDPEILGKLILDTKYDILGGQNRVTLF